MDYKRLVRVTDGSNTGSEGYYDIKDANKIEFGKFKRWLKHASPEKEWVLYADDWVLPEDGKFVLDDLITISNGGDGVWLASSLQDDEPIFVNDIDNIGNGDIVYTWDRYDIHEENENEGIEAEYSDYKKIVAAAEEGLDGIDYHQFSSRDVVEVLGKLMDMVNEEDEYVALAMAILMIDKDYE